MKKTTKKKSTKKKSVAKKAPKSAKTPKAAKPPKAAKTKSASAKKAPKSAKKPPVPAQASTGQVVNKQPQSKQQAAVASGMFLYADDAWSLRYFDQNDLHCKEREVFG